MRKQRGFSICLSAFLIPICLLGVVLFLCRIHPFGDRTLILWDADGQYLALLTYMRRVLLGQADAFYSFSKAAGGSMAGLIAYYLASPLNLLLVLFSEEQMISAFQFLVAVKIGLCGLTSAVALRRRADKGWGILLFSTAYALMGYMACYCWNVMWLDGVILLPLIADGIQTILAGRRPLAYCLWLSLALWSNYYIGYMLCLFSVIWFAYSYVQRKLSGQEISTAKVFITFSLASLLAGGLSAAMLLPAFRSLHFAGENSLSLQPLYPLIEIATKLFTGSISYEQLRYGLPNIYIGLPLLVLFGCYAINPFISRSKRIVSAVLIGVFLLSFQASGLYMLWHGFDAPNAMPARFSFLFSFVLIYLAYEGYCHLPSDGNGSISSRMGYLALAFFAGSCILFSSGIPAYLAYETVVFDVVCFLISCSLVAILRGKRKTLVLVALFVIEVAGLTGNLYFSIHRLEDVDTLRVKDYETFVTERQNTVTQISDHDNSLYRVETNDYRTENDPLVFGYRGLSHYTSDFDPAFASFARRLGLFQSHYRIMYAAGTTPVLESIFGIKYIIHDEAQSLAPLPEDYQLLWQQEEDAVWLNPYALPLAFLTENTDAVELSSDNPFENQNLLIKDLTGLSEPVFTPAKADLVSSESTIRLSFEQPADIPTYFSSDGSWFSFNGNVPEKMGRFIGCVKAPNTDETLENELIIYKDAGYAGGGSYVACLNEAAFQSAHETLTRNSCTVESSTDSHLLIHTPEKAHPSQLVLSIPYDEGWMVQIDGELAEATQRYDALLAVNLPEGAHTIELTFAPAGWKNGLVISLTSALLLLLGIAFAYLPALVSKKKRSL